MPYYIIGLGNPGEEYEDSRHNAGRAAVEFFRKKNKFPEWSHGKRANALVSAGKAEGKNVTLVLPETYMNKSGSAVKRFVKNKKAAEKLVVVYDDLDLPRGTLKVSFAKSSGGHRGIASIISGLKTKDFIRLRIGIAPATPSGKAKKPKGEQKVIDFILKKLAPKEQNDMKALYRKAEKALLLVVKEGREAAMNEIN